MPPNLDVLQNLSVFIRLPHQYQLEEGYLGSGPGLGKGRKIPAFQINSGEDSAKNGSTLAKALTSDQGHPGLTSVRLGGKPSCDGSMGPSSVEAWRC